MILGFHSHRNAPSRSAGQSDPDALRDSSEQETPYRAIESKNPCFGSSSRLSFKRVLLTQGLLRRLPAAKEVYNWASYLKHLQSIEFDVDRAPESPNSFDSFKKDASL